VTVYGVDKDNNFKAFKVKKFESKVWFGDKEKISLQKDYIVIQHSGLTAMKNIYEFGEVEINKNQLKFFNKLLKTNKIDEYSIIVDHKNIDYIWGLNSIKYLKFITVPKKSKNSEESKEEENINIKKNWRDLTIEIPSTEEFEGTSYKAVLSKLKEWEDYVKIVLNLSINNSDNIKHYLDFLSLKVHTLGLKTQRGVVSKMRKKQKDLIIDKILEIPVLKNFLQERANSDIKIFLRNMGPGNKQHLSSLLSYCIGGHAMPTIQPDYLDYTSVD